MKLSSLIFLLLSYNPFSVNQECDNRALVINKRFQHAYLYCMENMMPEKVYPISTARIEGRKEKRKDGKTPEGFFYIINIIDTSGWKIGGEHVYGSLAFRIDYAFEEDRKNNGVEDALLHGTPENKRQGVLKGSPQSHGCIRLLDEDIIDLEVKMKMGEPIIIYDSYEKPDELLLKYLEKL